MKDETYQFPPIYNFPPFFTKQPNLNTYQTQLEQWKNIIIGYCKSQKIWAISIKGVPLNSEDDDEEEDDDYMFNDDEQQLGAIEELNDNKTNGKSIFKNDQIERVVPNEFIIEILEYLIKSNVGEWIDPKNKNHGILIYWHTVEEWSQILYDWIDNTGQQSTIMTIYEIRKGDLAIHQEFYGMQHLMMVRVLEQLVKLGKASIMKGDDNKICGVKFGSV